MRYEIVSGKEYPVYSREEADELGLSYKNPFETLEGEYGLSSDDEVAICLKRNKLKSGTYKVKYPWGPSFIRKAEDIIISKGRPNNYGDPPTKKRNQSIRKKADWKKLAHLMAQPGMTTNNAIRLVYGHVNDSKRWNVRKTMRTEVFNQMTKDELDKIVEQFPIGKMDTAKALAAVLDKVMDWDGEDMGKKGDPKIAMTVLDKLMDMNDMKGKGKVITTRQIEASTVESTLADIQEKKKMFKAIQTEEKNELAETTEKEEEKQEEV